MKNLFAILFVAMISLSFTSCSDDSDPTPVTPPTTTKTNKEIVQATLVGTWKFDSVRVTEISTGKSAFTSTCTKAELSKSGLFTNDKWKNITPEPNFIYSGSSTVGYNLPCVTGNPTENMTYTVTEKTDKTVDVTLSNGRVFNVIATDVDTTKKTISASLVNTDGYKVYYSFSLK